PRALKPRTSPMKALAFGSARWRDAAAAWRPRGAARLELWLPREWPGTDAELRWRRTESGGAVRQGSQRGLEGLASAEEIVVWTPGPERVLRRRRRRPRAAAKTAQALPSAPEDQRAAAPEKLPFAFTQEAAGTLAAGVTRRDRMGGGPPALAAGGLGPSRL